ncbi:MAG: flavodoxin [Oscillospiraceae bacterium]
MLIYVLMTGLSACGNTDSPVDNFITQNDFTGKTVIPFCTSASSGLGQSGELLRDMAGTGNWLEGQRFREDPSEEDITEWVEGLGL